VVNRAQLITGRPTLPTPPIALRAGPLALALDGVDLRHVTLSGVELVQRVYMAVRDAPWNTIPPVISDLVIEPGVDSCHVRFHARHRHEAIDFEWDGTITGTPDGLIRYELDGVCHGTFQYSKIGFNVHHALAGSVGRRYRAQTETGELRGVLPDAIDPQRIVDGTLSGMFAPYRELAIEVVDGTEAVVAIEGDLMELQDHRNWTDANFKSYATPLALGFPFDSRDGQRIRQVVTIRYAGLLPSAVDPGDAELRIGAVIGPLPRFGLGMASHGRSLAPGEVELVRALRPDHLRVDLVLRDGSWAGALDRAIGDARAVGAGLELAVSANASSGEQLDDLAGRLASADVRVDRVLVHALADGFSAFVSTTPATIVRLVRDRLSPVVPGALFAGGTDQNFSDINRERPSDPVFQGLCCSVSPTIHAADDASIVENIAGAAELVRFARTFRDGAPDGRAIIISPVTIATRFGPYPAGPAAAGDLPPAVDVRQASLLGAAWTCGELAAFASAGAASVTWYETTGWRGVLETTDGSPMPDRFPSTPGQVFPVWHVFAALSGWHDGRVLAVSATDPLRITGLAVRMDERIGMLVANVTPVAQRVRITGLEGQAVSVRLLDDASAVWALADPVGFQAAPGATVPVRGGAVWLALGPYAVARLDASAPALH
jgi:D-apionolactonase